MILYFSATGNSAYVAKQIAQGIQDDVMDLFQRIRTNDISPLASDRPWVIVTPTYAWQMPNIVMNWLSQVTLQGNQTVYFVLTCAGSIRNAGAYLKRLCHEKGWNDQGTMEIIMPENYIALFHTVEPIEAKDIVNHADQQINDCIEMICHKKPFPQPTIGFQDVFSSGFVHAIFYPLFVHAKKFYATSACISCGLCERVCPLENIQLREGSPTWGTQCTHCMACINRCPASAIEYGKHSIGQSRYQCPGRNDSD